MGSKRDEQPKKWKQSIVVVYSHRKSSPGGGKSLGGEKKAENRDGRLSVTITTNETAGPPVIGMPSLQAAHFFRNSPQSGSGFHYK